MTTAVEVARWMQDRLRQEGVLHQQDAVAAISDTFGSPFAYETDGGTVAIAKDVLDQFRKLNGRDVVWSRSERLWRPREPGDEGSRAQP